MPETIQLFRVLLAAPSDVTEEHALVADAVNDWNVLHGDTAKARLELMNWRTHAHPETGRRPQALINRQFADRADVVLAIFWRRLGSPTGRADSGTVEEIERAQRRGKKVMVYFSQRAGIENAPVHSREQARMERFRRKLGRNALYGTYGNVQEFAAAVRKDLALVMREVVTAARRKR
jgi:nucleoside 2-deoxyribosyltransferase